MIAPAKKIYFMRQLQNFSFQLLSCPGSVLEAFMRTKLRRVAKYNLILQLALIIAISFFFAAVPALFAQDDAINVNGEKLIYNVLDTYATQESEFTDEASPYKELKEVLTSEDFSQDKEVWSLRFKEKKGIIDDDADFTKTAGWVKTLRKISAYILRAFIVITAVSLLILLVVIFRKMKKNLFKNNAAQSINAYIDPKLNVQELLSNSINLFESGNERQAWSVCFCAILRAFEKLQIIFPENATEYECLKFLRQNAAQYADDFLLIIKDRIKIAYANMLLPKDNFDKAISFCRTIILQAQTTSETILVSAEPTSNRGIT
ncbi:MAG: hypothetical protein Ta2B_06060 [Termitinemataceae bacterium]|nr:MAG: hypothetical protein Ta2B_06060 [Termitinemataceae bacterium]